MANERAIADQLRTTDELDEAIDDARAEKRRIEDERSAAVRDATWAIHERFAEAMRSANAAVAAAEQAKREHVDATAAHPWDGKRVFRMVVRHSRWGSSKTETREDGIVEVVRQASAFPANMTWRTPSLGTVIVRKIKKDGSASTQFHSNYGNIEEKWKLAD